MKSRNRLLQTMRSPATLAWVLAGGLSTLGVIALALWFQGGEKPPVSPLPGVEVLDEAQMKAVVGGWLEPKSRNPRGGCLACQLCNAGQSSGGSPAGGSPRLDATTAEVSDSMSLLSVGPSNPGLSLGLTYSSDLADGTNTVLDTTLGAGWTHSYNSFLLQRGTNVFWVAGDTEVVRFVQHGSTYTPATGRFMELTFPQPDNAEIRFTDGTVHRFRRQSVPWQPAGTVYVLDAIVDPNQRVTQLTYDGNGLLSMVTDPFGNQITFAHGPDGKLARVSAAGREATFACGPTGQLSTVVLPGGGQVAYEYNFRAQITTKTVPEGDTWRVDYNDTGKATGLRDTTGAPVATQISTTNWAIDRVLSQLSGEMRYVPGTATVTDGNGNPWKYVYDDRGNVTERHDPLGNVTRIEYDPAVLEPRWIRDANGNSTYYEYDERGNRTVVRDAEGNETRFEYEPVHNRMTRKIEPDGDEWGWEYDDRGNLLKEIDPLHGPGGPFIQYAYDPLGHLIRKIDRNGNQTRWEYNAQGHVSKVIDPAGCVTEHTYDYFGNVLTTTVHNENGDQTTTYTYDARGRVLTETDPLGVTTRYEYDADGNRIAVYTDWTDPTYRSVTRYYYEQRDRLFKMIEDEGPGHLNRTTEYRYDGNDNKTLEINPNGVRTEYHYDAANRLIRTVLDPGGLKIEREHGYDAVGNRTSEIDPNDHTTTYEYDVLNRLERQIVDPSGLHLVTQYRYFPPGGGGCCGTPGSSLIKCIIDAEGKVTRYEYDALDRRMEEIRQVGLQDCDRDPLPGDAVTLYSYDPMGNLLVRTDPNGNTTTYTYTRREEVATVANGCAETTTYAYDCAGNRVEERRPNGNVIEHAHDLNNQLRHVEDSLGLVARYTYDRVGNRISEADALGHTICYRYDKLNRLVMQIDAMDDCDNPAHPTHYEYDLVGNLLKVIDREGNHTVYDYDAANRRTAMRYWPDAGGPPALITYRYDQAGNLTRITDANGNATAYEYDAADRRITEIFADGTAQRFTYDGVGGLLTREDNMGEGPLPGNITTYTYDDLHRLIRRAYANGEIDVLAYDKGGRMLSADNNHSHVGFTYDCADRVLSTTQTDLPQTYSYTLGYAYNVAAGTRTLTYPSGKVLVETRDRRDRLWKVTQDNQLIAEYAYDLADRMLTKTFGNGTRAEYAYNDNDWITSLAHRGLDNKVFAGFAHDYDREGNRLNAVNLQEVIPYDPKKPVTHSEQYAYDDIYRLTDYKRGRWIGGGIPTPRRHRDWQLDPVHNWKKFGIYDLDTGENALYCDSINQMNEYDDHSTDGACPVPDDDGLPDDFMVSPCPPQSKSGLQVGQVGGAVSEMASPAAPIRAGWEHSDRAAGPRSTGYNQRHDKNGNLVDDGIREYYYDYQTDPNSCPRSENRLTMVKEKATSKILGQYWYDALGRRIRKLTAAVSTIYVLAPEWREMEEYEAGALVRSYVYGPWLDEVLLVERQAEPESVYLHAGALGTIFAATSSLGVPVERYAFDLYGAAAFYGADGQTIPQSAIDNSYLFTGRVRDAETGLQYSRARYYDPQTGRFLARDPAAFSAAVSVYHYALSNPVTYLDTTGRNPIVPFVVGVLASITANEITDALKNQEGGKAGDNFGPAQNVDATCDSEKKFPEKCPVGEGSWGTGRVVFAKFAWGGKATSWYSIKVTWNVSKNSIKNLLVGWGQVTLYDGNKVYGAVSQIGQVEQVRSPCECCEHTVCIRLQIQVGWFIDNTWPLSNISGTNDYRIKVCGNSTTATELGEGL